MKTLAYEFQVQSFVSYALQSLIPSLKLGDATFTMKQQIAFHQ